MVRSFSGRPLDPQVVGLMLDRSLRAPTAGNARGTAWLALEGPEQTTTYWSHTTTDEWRRRSRRWPGLSRAPVVALSLVSPHEYVRRYDEPDKAGGGGGAATWPVPYWFGDAAFATMSLLLQATAEGLGACFLGNFRGEGPLLAALGVPNEWRLFGAVLLGRAGGPDPRSPSLDRPGPAPSARLHRGRWEPAD